MAFQYWVGTVGNATKQVDQNINQQKPVKMGNFNKEYYVMRTDGADNHPLLGWGDTSKRPFTSIKEIDTSDLGLPLSIEFDTPYPSKPELVDILDLGSTCVLSEKMNELLTKLNMPKNQFVPAKIRTNKKESITGHSVFHCANCTTAVDKDNDEGDEPNGDGHIREIEQSSLDKKNLRTISQGERLLFRLAENTEFTLVRKSIKEAERATGSCFFQISKWSSSVIFE